LRIQFSIVFTAPKHHPNLIKTIHSLKNQLPYLTLTSIRYYVPGTFKYGDETGLKQSSTVASILGDQIVRDVNM